LTSIAATARSSAVATRLAERLVNGLLFLTILSGFMVRIEPAPYEGLFALLAIACIVARVRVDRRILPLIVLLMAWNIGGLLSLPQVSHDTAAVTFVAVSIYLAVSAIIFACLFSDDVEHRLFILRSAYTLAAITVTLIGLAGYFVYVGEDALTGRVRGTFKDPNVFGPFLIFPILLLATDLFLRRLSLWKFAATVLLLFGLLMSFSRGAWLNFAVSALVMAGLMVLTASTPRIRRRLIAMAVVALIALTGIIAAALSIEAVGNMFEERAKVTQDYDVGDRGRFTSQGRALSIVLDHPNGVGPFQLRHYTGIDPHQVYLNAFASYGWIGGFAYLALTLVTLVAGFQSLLWRTAWQPALVAIYAAYVGTVVEGLVIDTDHWRHYYILLGTIWGLTVATDRARRRAHQLPEAAARYSAARRSAAIRRLRT
jgi:O-antigen ligase